MAPFEIPALHRQLLADLGRLQPGRLLAHVGVDEIADAAREDVAHVGDLPGAAGERAGGAAEMCGGVEDDRLGALQAGG